MFGSKFRSWMEAVRPRKKQHRKDKQTKSNQNNISPSNRQNSTNCQLSENDVPVIINGGTCKMHPPTRQGAPTSSRYSANNLSSPESAYSTGYSTDGTSPGAPPDYYINVRTGVKYFSAEGGDRYSNDQQLRYIQRQQRCLTNGDKELVLNSKQISNLAVHQNGRKPPLNNTQTQEVDTKAVQIQSRSTPSSSSSSAAYQVGNNNVTTTRLNEVIGSPILTSPRQRNRIRTNPWVPTSALSPGQVRQDFTKAVTTTNLLDSPISRKFQSPSSVVRNTEINCRSLSSSSCSSLSGTSLHWENKRINSGSDEDDCTLNEMMGKYDESYVYEKETDILSDSDPTDCDTDIDTGQDGGDEDDQLEGEFDFIDNGSYLELEPKHDRNTGHCVYYNFEIQRKISRRRTTKKTKQINDKKRRSSSNKKRHKQLTTIQLDGSKSAGATPLSVRRTNNSNQISKLALEDCLKKRSNSISFSRDPITTTIDKRDKEADRKYKELIVEAEHILRSMKINGLSPRRVPGPTNKRVEILRSAECAKPELFMKNRLIDEISTQFNNKIPSNNFNCPRFSPKKNHITNFINSNSPVLLRRENELPKSPLVVIKKTDDNSQLNRKNETNRRSPKYRKKSNKIKLQQECFSTSSESEKEDYNKIKHFTSCPQSEPVRRKVYSGHTKTVAFNLNCENKIRNNLSPTYSPTHHTENMNEYKLSAENLRQQVLLNTIANLKRSLEDQSASLKQVYKSSQNIHL